MERTDAEAHSPEQTAPIMDDKRGVSVNPTPAPAGSAPVSRIHPKQPHPEANTGGESANRISVESVVPLWPDETIDLGQPSGERPRLVVFQPAGRPHEGERFSDAPRRAVIVLPGGGYTHRAEHEGAAVGRWLALHGLVGVVCHYRVSPHRHPAPFADAARAVRMTHAHAERWGIDSDGITLLGFSAGGHLAATVATQPDLHREPADDLLDRFSARPDRLVLVYPVISMLEAFHAGSMRALLGEDPDPALRRRLSLEHQVTADTPPTFLVHAADDTAVPVSNTLRFAAALDDHHIPFALHIHPRGGHGFGLGLGLQRQDGLGSWTTRLLDWLHGPSTEAD